MRADSSREIDGADVNDAMEGAAQASSDDDEA